MTERAGPDKEQVIDALVLVFAHSDIAKVVGTDALRSVLAVEYHDMIEGNIFDMQQLWELLADQPGFDATAAEPPLCLLKNWESKLSLEFQLPEHLAEMSDRDRALRAAQCRVPTAESKRVLRVTAPPPVASRARRDSLGRGARSTLPPPGKPRQRPAWQGWLAGIVAAATMTFVGITLYGHCQGANGHWDQAQVTLTDLPTRSVRRMGSQVRAEVDPSNVEQAGCRRQAAEAPRRAARGRGSRGRGDRPARGKVGRGHRAKAAGRQRLRVAERRIVADSPALARRCA